MPLKDDLIERTLEQLAEVVRDLRGMHAQRAAQEAERFLQDAYQEHTGTQAELLKRLSSQQILNILSSAGTIDREKAFLMGALFQAEAQLAIVRDSGDADELKLKSYDLYLEAALAELDVEDLDDYIAALETELDAFVLPEETSWRRFEYAWLRGNFAEAEDKLFDLLELTLANHNEPTARLEDRGRKFYLTLQNTSEEKLVAGGLPLEEVREGSSAFNDALVRATS